MYYFEDKLFSVYKLNIKYLDDNFVLVSFYTFLVCCLLLTWLIIIFSSHLKLKTAVLFLFLMHWFLCTRTDSQRLSFKNSSQSLIHSHTLSNYSPVQKMALSILKFIFFCSGFIMCYTLLLCLHICSCIFTLFKV